MVPDWALGYERSPRDLADRWEWEQRILIRLRAEARVVWSEQLLAKAGLGPPSPDAKVAKSGSMLEWVDTWP